MIWTASGMRLKGFFIFSKLNKLKKKKILLRCDQWISLRKFKSWIKESKRSLSIGGRRFDETVNSFQYNWSEALFLRFILVVFK